MFRYTITSTGETGVVDEIELKRRFPELMAEIFYSKNFKEHTVRYKSMIITIERID